MASGLAPKYSSAKPAIPNTVAYTRLTFAEIRPLTSTRFLVLSILMSISRSITLLKTQPDATTSDTPTSEVLLKHYTDSLVGHHVVVEVPHDPQFAVQMQEVNQVNQHLNDCTDQHNAEDGSMRSTTIHYHPERDCRQDDREDEADHINNGKHADPNHVQEVPEQAQTHDTGTVSGVQTAFRDLEHQHGHPDQTRGHVQTVRTDQCKEAGQEATTVWTEAFSNQVMEFIDFHPDKARTKQEGQRQPADNGAFVFLVHGDNSHAVGDGA
ncbi:hypothetical protein COLO4_02019 [Corchorus olitorius]|uniref:Uncharacterized protein n=1 Tax=Corchorus olitorius TaxID=93759 RepID=A0A1R3L1M5_9ROSI|nr:hypothetical protein COLO4_02019 [Corchorus olitorius]